MGLSNFGTYPPLPNVGDYFTFRKAIPTDFEQIYRKLSNYPELSSTMPPSLRDAINLGEMVVCEAPQGVLAAFMEYHTLKNGTTSLYNISVLKPFRRMGVALTLLSYLPDPCRCTVRDDNPKGKALFLTAGFDLVKTEMGQKTLLCRYTRGFELAAETGG